MCTVLGFFFSARCVCACITAVVLDDLFDGDVSNVEKYKYKIRTIQSGFQLKWSQFENMTVGVFKRLKNIHGSYTIAIVKKKLNV